MNGDVAFGVITTMNEPPDTRIEHTCKLISAGTPCVHAHIVYLGLTGRALGLMKEDTGNASRNIPNIGKNVPDTMCGLVDIRNIFRHIPDTE